MKNKRTLNMRLSGTQIFENYTDIQKIPLQWPFNISYLGNLSRKRQSYFNFCM